MALSKIEGDRTRFIKMTLVILEELTPLLQDILHDKISPHLLLSKVARHKTLFYNLRTEQLSLVQKANIDGYKEFDITLSYTLLRNLKCINVTTPTQGWGISMMPGNLARTKVETWLP